MTRLFLALAVFASLAMQETTLPADHWCLAGPPLEKDKPKAHECACKLICETDEEGTITQREAQDCKMYCVKNRCMCHTDDGCSHPKT